MFKKGQNLFFFHILSVFKVQNKSLTVCFELVFFLFEQYLSTFIKIVQLFLEVLAFNDEILLISDSFCNFAIRKQYRFTIAKYTPYIKPRYVTREGTTVLYVRYNYNRTKRTLISTGYSIKPEHWDSKKRWIKRACPNYDEIDACLIRITSKLGEILTYAKINGISPTVDLFYLN